MQGQGACDIRGALALPPPLKHAVQHAQGQIDRAGAHAAAAAAGALAHVRSRAHAVLARPGAAAPARPLPAPISALATRLRAALAPPQPADDTAGGFTLRVTDTRRTGRLARVRGGVGFAAVIPGDSVAESVITSGIASTLSLYQTTLIVRLILTWFPNPPQALAGPLSTICDPYLNLFRGIIPPLGGIDLSPILAFVTLDLLSGSAASLGAEIPAELPAECS